jgi:mitogen-activated protein kinase kinase kinase 4
MNYKFTPSPSKETIDDFHGTEEYEVIQSLPSGLNLPKLDNERTPLASITTLEYEDEELTTLTQQESTESDTSSCPTITTDNFLLPEQVEALHEVDSILEDLQKFESLYPCTGKIEDDRYRCSKFKRRRDAIVLWSKITRGLADNLVHLSKWLGMPVNPFPHSQSPTDQPLTMQPLPLSSGETSQSTDINPEESLTFSAISSSLRTQSSVFSTSSSSTNYSRTTLQRMFSSAHASSLEDDRHSSHGVYSRFVNQTLKKEGLQYLIEKLLQFISPILDFAEEAMKVYPYSPDEETKEEQPERQPLLRSYLPANNSDKPFKRATSTAPRCWMDEFASMNLPSFSEIYLQLTRVPLDIMNECMILRTAHSGGIPTNYSVGKLVREFHIALKKAVKVRRFYRRKVHVLTYNNPGGLDMLDADMELFEENLQSILQLYFTYVEHYLRSSGTHRNLMESEWERAKLICTDISSGEVEAGLRFCHIALQIVENLEHDFKRRIDECCDKLHESSDTLDDTDDQKKIAFMELCREFKTTIQDVRENSMKALGFARTLMNDLEIAAELSICCPKEQLLDLLAESEHCQVIIPHSQSCMSCMLFVPQTIADDHYMIQQLLGVSFGRPTNIVDDEDEIDASAGVIEDDITHDIPKNSYISDKKYLLVIKFDMKELQPHWKGRNINLTLSAETIVSISEMQVEGIKLIVDDSICLEDNLMTFITSMSSSVEVTNKKTSSHHSVSERINELKITLCRFGHVIIDIVQRINSNLSVEEINEREDLLQHYQPTMQTCYNLGFEYIQDLARLFGDEYIHQKLGVEMLHFAIQWMIFVTTKCSRGHGKRPRWAVLGLEFILLACSPRMLATISHTKYENVKKQMERCLTHVIGEAPLRSSSDLESAATYSETTKAIKRRGRRKFPIRVLSVQHTLNHIREEDLMDISSADSSDIDSANDGPPTARDFSSQEFIASYYNSLDSPCLHDVAEEEKDVDCDKSTKLQSIQEQCEALEVRRDDELRKKRLIGRVTDRGGVSALELHKLTDIKQSHFNWRRGRKLGEKNHPHTV